MLACDGAHYLFNKTDCIRKIHSCFRQAIPQGIVVKTDLDMEKVNAKLLENGIMGGLCLGNGMVEFAVTEKRTKEEIDTLVNLMLEA